VGWFDESYVRDSEVVVIRSPQGSIVAFANLLSTTSLKEISIDMMRHRADMPHGSMDFLFLALLEEGKRRGFEQFSLGLSALSGLRQEPHAPALETAIEVVTSHLERFYHFQGLHAYKAKFRPVWEPRYLIYPSAQALPEVLLALVRADSGDRLWDYLWPH
jgi:phosphatidylglycerol lysyltransferase